MFYSKNSTHQNRLNRRSEDASYSLQAILSQSKPDQCNHIFRKPIKKISRHKTTGYLEWLLDGNLCFRALFKKIGSVGTPSRFSFLFSRTLCFYSALETISFCRKSGHGGCETAQEPNSLCNSPSVEVIQDVGCNHPAVHTHSRKVNAYYFFVISYQGCEHKVVIFGGALNRVIEKAGWFSPTGLLRTAELGAPCKKNGQLQVTQKEQQIVGHSKRTANCRSRKKNSRL